MFYFRQLCCWIAELFIFVVSSESFSLSDWIYLNLSFIAPGRLEISRDFIFKNDKAKIGRKGRPFM